MSVKFVQRGPWKFFLAKFYDTKSGPSIGKNKCSEFFDKNFVYIISLIVRKE